MTVQHMAEVGLTATVAGVTAAGAMVGADVSGVPTWLVTLGASGLVGYFAAQITVRSELASLRTELRLMRAELHRYYPTRGEVGSHPTGGGDEA